MLSELRFEGQAVVVTGAASGIGRATSEVLAELGACVYAMDRDAAGLKGLASDLGGAGLRCETVTGDVTVEQDAQRLAERLLRDGARLKALVNNAGANRILPLPEVTLAQWNELVSINLTSFFLLSRALLPQLLAAKQGGAIVNISSGYGLVGGPNMAAYSSAKAGVIGLTRQLACEYAAQGLRVNAVCPGLTLSPRVREYVARGLVDAAGLRTQVLGGRFAECREIANVIAFLASDAASYMTGAVVPVDGGQSAR